VRPIRVLYLLTTLNVGGAERSLLEALRKIKRSRVEPVVCSLISGGQLRDAFAELDIPVVELGVRPGLAESRGLQVLPLLRRYRPAIVHSRLILSNLWARLGVLVGAKVISDEQGLANERPALMTSLNRLSQPLCAMNLANSQAVAGRMRRRDRIPPHRLRVIYCGIDCRKFVPNPERHGRFDIVTTARLERYKGVLDLIDAMRIISRERPSTTLSVVGDGSQRADLERRVKELELSDVVTFWGQQADVAARLPEGSLFVLSSHEEGLPNAAIEAMSCALPVVATRVWGTPELVVDNVTGLLAPPRDPRALAVTSLRYLENPNLAQAHGAAGRERALRYFDVQATATAYEDLYQELLG
jgi:glycosyltransferase involved in cell wall biosynthesis